MMQAHGVALENTEVATSPFAESEEVFRAATAALASPEARGMTHSELEREVTKQGQKPTVSTDGWRLVRRRQAINFTSAGMGTCCVHGVVRCPRAKAGSHLAAS